jgi:DNA-binding response OmpR family regulator
MNKKVRDVIYKEEKPPLRVLIIEDHQDLAENIGDFLETRGHMPDYAMDGIGGLHLALTGQYDVIVLDIMLPGMDGLTLCRKLREEAGTETPVLMLTARDQLKDKLTGFDSGADDYLVKPFALEELLARIHAVSRRGMGNGPKTMCVGDLEMDSKKYQVTRSGKLIPLTQTCFRILKMLMEAYPNVVPRKEIIVRLWGDMPPGSDALRSHLYALRLEVDKPFSYPMIQTVRGIGFRLVVRDED